jgi:hypothetical protein
MSDFQRFVPAPDGGKDAVWIGSPDKGLVIFTDGSLPMPSTRCSPTVSLDSGTRDRRSGHY